MSVLRAAAHVHSDWSYDGRRSLAEIARTFTHLRYGAVLLSEHDRGWNDERWAAFQAACREASTGILLVPGVEYSDADNAVHVLVWGCEPFLGAGLETSELLDRVAEHGGVAILAHPGRRGVADALDHETLRRFDGIEVWNRKYDGIEPGARAGRLATALDGVRWAGLDFHTYRQLFPLAMRVTVRNGSPSTQAVFEALRAGRVEARALGISVRRAQSPPLHEVLGQAERARRAGARRKRLAARGSK